MTTNDIATSKALDIAFNLVQDRHKLISQRELFERDLVEERMLLIAGAILCKLISDENKNDDTTNTSN